MKAFKNASSQAVCTPSGKASEGDDGNPCCCACDPIYKPARKCSDDSLTTIIMTSTDAATLTGAFKYSGTCYYFGSDALRCKTDADTLITAGDATGFADCDACDADACPVSCDEGALASTYSISGYSDGYFGNHTGDGCDDCGTDDDSAKWHGLWVDSGGTCAFQPGNDLFTDGMCVNHNRERDSSFLGYVGAPGTCWELRLICGVVDDVPVYLWRGVKNTGSTPAGTYTRTDGLDSRATVVIA